jgi:hypothetical protein
VRLLSGEVVGTAAPELILRITEPLPQRGLVITMATRSLRLLIPLAVSGAGLCLLSLTACSSSPSATSSGNDAAAGGGGAGSAVASAPAGQASSATVNACTLVTAAELSQAVGVQYTSISGSGGVCEVMGPGTASFNYTVQKESPTNTWAEQVATIKGDDGQALSEPGIGDKAVWGGKEFAAEADGDIVGVIGADFPSTPQGSGFTRTGEIAKLLISKL